MKHKRFIRLEKRAAFLIVCIVSEQNRCSMHTIKAQERRFRILFTDIICFFSRYLRILSYQYLLLIGNLLMYSRIPSGVMQAVVIVQFGHHHMLPRQNILRYYATLFSYSFSCYYCTKDFVVFILTRDYISRVLFSFNLRSKNVYEISEGNRKEINKCRSRKRKYWHIFGTAKCLSNLQG